MFIFCLLSVCPLQYSKHLFVHIGQTNPSYSDPLLEAVDIRQIYDKFPEKKGGLKELYEKGPQNAFFLVKFWVGCWYFTLVSKKKNTSHITQILILKVLILKFNFSFFLCPCFIYILCSFCPLSLQSNNYRTKHRIIIYLRNNLRLHRGECTLTGICQKCILWFNCLHQKRKSFGIT